RDFHVTGVQTCALPISVAVEDGRHLARATGAARGALTELGARLGSDTYLGHDETPWWIIPRSDGETRLLRKTAPLHTSGKPPHRSEERRVGKADGTQGW